MKELTLSLDASTSATGWAVYDGPDLLDSGVVKPKGTFLERALQMANKLKAIQSRLILKYNKPFKEIVIEQNNVGGGNQQTMVKIGIATGIILSRLIADRVYFVNVRTWRKHFAIKGKGRQVKTISNTRGHHYSANYREWLHKEIKAIDKKLKEIEGDMIDGY